MIASARRVGRRVGRRVSVTWGRGMVWVARAGVDEQTLLLAFAAIVGAAAALGTVAFYAAIDASYHLFFRWTSGDVPLFARLAYRPMATAVAMGAAAALWRWSGRGGDGLTVPDVQLAVVRKGGFLPLGAALGRTAASAVSIGGGGSAGAEGPVAVLGAATGSWLSRVFRFSEGRTRVLVASGTAAGISAAFNAPIAGAFFALEEILGTFRGDHFAPVVVASVIGAVISRGAFGDHPAFALPQHYGYDHALEVLWAFPLLGIVCGLMAVAFVRSHFAIAEALGALRSRAVVRRVLPWVAGAVIGLSVALSRGLLVGTGHLAIPLTTFAEMTWWTLLVVAGGKMLITSLTLHGGGSGGVFTPSLYVGAALGSALGLLLREVVPGFTSAPEAYALVGMGAMVAATTGAPITAALLVFEISADYAIVAPLLVSVAISQALLRRVQGEDLYSGWLRRRGEAVVHGQDRRALETLHVREAYSPTSPVLSDAAPLSAVLALFSETAPALVPVVDDEQRLVGVLTSAEIGLLARTPEAMDARLLASDLAVPCETLTPDDSLAVAMRRMAVRGLGALPVVEAATDRVIGVLDRGHMLDLYDRAVSSR